MCFVGSASAYYCLSSLEGAVTRVGRGSDKHCQLSAQYTKALIAWLVNANVINFIHTEVHY